MAINDNKFKFDIDEFFEQTMAKNEEIKNRSSAVQAIFAENAKNSAELIKSATDVNSNSMTVLAAKEFEDLKAQRNVQAQATRMGINPGVASEVLDAVSDEWKTATLNSIEKHKKLQNALEVKFFDAPMTYIKEQINMENTVAQAEAAARRSSGAIQSLSSIQQMTQNLPNQMNALKQTKSDVIIDATLKEAKARADAGIAEMRMKNAGVQVEELKLLNSLSAQELNNTQAAVAMRQSQVNADRNYDLNLKQFEQQKQAFNIQMEERADRIAQKKLNAEELEGTANTVRLGAATMGFENVKAFPTAKIMNLLAMKDGKMMDFFRAGMTSEATGKPVVTDDAGQAARIIADHIAPLRPEQKVIKEFFGDVWHTAATPAAGQTYDPTKKDQVTTAARNIALGKAVESAKNIKDGDNTNIYSPPPLGAVMDLGPVKNSAWYKEVMATQMITGTLQEFKPQQLADLTVVAVKAGKLKHNEAVVGLQAAFNAAKALNNATRNYEGFGLPPQMGYQTTITHNNGSRKTYNLTEAKDVGTLLNKRLQEAYITSNPMRAPGYHD